MFWHGVLSDKPASRTWRSEPLMPRSGINTKTAAKQAALNQVWLCTRTWCNVCIESHSSKQRTAFPQKPLFARKYRSRPGKGKEVLIHHISQLSPNGRLLCKGESLTIMSVTDSLSCCCCKCHAHCSETPLSIHPSRLFTWISR